MKNRITEDRIVSSNGGLIQAINDIDSELVISFGANHHLLDVSIIGETK